MTYNNDDVDDIDHQKKETKINKHVVQGRSLPRRIMFNKNLYFSDNPN